ncbi:hypothetical protein B0H19DRAFT_1263142 [Mycena capillaripes]|nr:hypothetical protein B0H19DRAFT_1263142 [Mycena capillaripes]
MHPPSTEPASPHASPIDLVPPELLCHIFTLAIPAQTPKSRAVPVIGQCDSDGWPLQRDPWILGGPWIFGQICSQWRTLATSLPTLWTHITLTTTLAPRELILLNIQLTRTANAPLNVLIRPTSGLFGPPHDQFYIFLAALLSHSARWRALHLDFEGDRYAPTALDTLGLHTMPLLESLVFSGRYLRYLGKHTFFKEAPALRRVVLGELGISSIPYITLPWSQLTTYKATYLAATHFQNLAAAVNLVECDINIGFSHAPDDILQHDNLTFPYLRRLSLSHPAFLDRLTAPVLERLYIIGAVQPILPFLDRSGCTELLTALTLSQCTASPPQIIAVLRHTHALTALALDLRCPPGELVAALAAPENLCPALTSLAWADLDDALDRHPFADMVIQRSSGSTGLRALRSVAVYAGRRRMKTAGSRLRAVPGLEVLILNAKKSGPAVEGWRAY